MAERIFGIFRGVEQHRNTLYCALWTQLEGIEQKTVYRISITRSNHGNIHSWDGPQAVKVGSKIEGFATGRPQKYVIGKVGIDSSKLDAWADELNRPNALRPHEFVVELLKKVEATNSKLKQKDWSAEVQDWWDTQTLMINEQGPIIRQRRPYTTKVTEKYDSLHQSVENCPVTDGLVKVREQKERYDPQHPVGDDPVNDGLFRGSSAASSPTRSLQRTDERRRPRPIVTQNRAPMWPQLDQRPYQSLPTTPVGKYGPERLQLRPSQPRNHYRHPSQPLVDPRMQQYSPPRKSPSYQDNRITPYKQHTSGNSRRRPPRSNADRRRNDKKSRDGENHDLVSLILNALTAATLK